MSRVRVFEPLLIGAPGRRSGGITTGAFYPYYGGTDRDPARVDIGRDEYDGAITSSGGSGDRIGSVAVIARDVLWSGSPDSEIVIGAPDAGRELSEGAGLTCLFPPGWITGPGDWIDIDAVYGVLVHGGSFEDRAGRWSSRGSRGPLNGENGGTP